MLRIMIMRVRVRRSRRALAKPGEREKYAKVPDCRTALRGTVLVQKPRNVSKTCVATLNASSSLGRSCELAKTKEQRKIAICAVQETMVLQQIKGHKPKVYRHSDVLYSIPRTPSGVGMIVSTQFHDRLAEVIFAANGGGIIFPLLMLHSLAAPSEPEMSFGA